MGCSPRSKSLTLARAADGPDCFRWLDHVSSAAGCSQPIRLAGRITTRDDGQVLTVLDTERMPDASSTIYRRDAYQITRAGVVGGKGVPTIVATNPAAFTTFTAPGFGPVHTRRTARAGAATPPVHAVRKTDACTGWTSARERDADCHAPAASKRVTPAVFGE